LNRHRLALSRAVLPLAALGAAVLLAACGSSSSSTSGGVASIGNAASTSPAAATQPQSAASREAALQKASQCMRDHGVKDFPDPTVDSSGNVRPGNFQLDRNDPSVRTAFQACRSLFAAARPQFSPAQQQALQDAILAYAKCMRTNGYDMPDPTFNGGGAGGPGGGGLFGNRSLNRNDPLFKKANTACRPTLQKALASAGLRGGFGRGPGGGGFGGGGAAG
jgi:hypothetical protein